MTPKQKFRSKRCKSATGRLTSTITLEELQQHFHLPTRVACKALGVGLTCFKATCRRLGLERWPYKAEGVRLDGFLQQSVGEALGEDDDEGPAEDSDEMAAAEKDRPPESAAATAADHGSSEAHMLLRRGAPTTAGNAGAGCQPAPALAKPEPALLAPAGSATPAMRDLLVPPAPHGPHPNNSQLPHSVALAGEALAAGGSCSSDSDQHQHQQVQLWAQAQHQAQLQAQLQAQQQAQAQAQQQAQAQAQQAQQTHQAQTQAGGPVQEYLAQVLQILRPEEQARLAGLLDAGVQQAAPQAVAPLSTAAPMHAYGQPAHAAFQPAGQRPPPPPQPPQLQQQHPEPPAQAARPAAPPLQATGMLPQAGNAWSWTPPSALHAPMWAGPSWTAAPAPAPHQLPLRGMASLLAALQPQPQQDSGPRIAALSAQLLALLRAGRVQDAQPTISQLQQCVGEQLALAASQLLGLHT